MRLLVTRPSEDADALAAKLELLGHQVISSPLLHIAPRADIDIPQDDRDIGGLWAELSGGKCRFMMVRDRQWQQIEDALR